MSSTCNGFAITEGRRSFALMPAVIQCDNRHARMDIRPLTREQIAAIPGVRFPLPRPPKVAAVKAEPKTDRKPATTAERRRMVVLYRHRMRIADIARTMGRDRSVVRGILIQAKVHTPRAARQEVLP